MTLLFSHTPNSEESTTQNSLFLRVAKTLARLYSE